MMLAEDAPVESLLVHGPGLPVQGTLVPVSFGAHGLQLREPSGRQVEVSYDRLTTRPGGWNGESLLLEWDSVDGPRTVLLKDPERFRSLVERLPQDMRQRLQGWRKDVRRNRRVLHIGLVVVIACTLVPLIAVSILMLNAQGLVRRAVDRIPVSWEQQLGQQAYRDLRLEGRIRTSGVAATTFAAVADRLTDQVDAPYSWEVVLVEDARLNAMALPAGHIVVWSGLLRQMRSEDELAGVLAHEIQHVVQRHSLQQTVHAMGMRTVLGLLVFGDGALDAVGRETAAQLTDLAYSRQQELEADAGARELLQQTPWDARAFVALLQRIDRSAHELPALLVSHPRGSERAAALLADDPATGGSSGAVTPTWRLVLEDLDAALAD